MSAPAVRLVSAAGGVLIAVTAYVVSSRVLGLSIDVAVGRLDFALNLAHFVAVTAAILVLALAAAAVLERRATHPQRVWLLFAFAGLLLSLVPTLLLVDGFGARGILMIAHLGVATVVIPGIAATLTDEKPAERGGSAPRAPAMTGQQR
jgi:drug/metabolite transporter (DMT)-like permease